MKKFVGLMIVFFVVLNIVGDTYRALNGLAFMLSVNSSFEDIIGYIIVMPFFFVVGIALFCEQDAPKFLTKWWKTLLIAFAVCVCIMLFVKITRPDSDNTNILPASSARAAAANIAQEDILAAIVRVYEHNYNEAYANLNNAYEKYHINGGLGDSTYINVSMGRAREIEIQFRDIAKDIQMQWKEKNFIIWQLENLMVKIYKDAMVLDGKASPSDPDSVGEALYADTGIPRPDKEQEPNVISEIIVESLKKYASEIICAVLMAITFLIFPKLKKFFKKDMSKR